MVVFVNELVKLIRLNVFVVERFVVIDFENRVMC